MDELVIWYMVGVPVGDWEYPFVFRAPPVAPVFVGFMIPVPLVDRGGRPASCLALYCCCFPVFHFRIHRLVASLIHRVLHLS